MPSSPARPPTTLPAPGGPHPAAGGPQLAAVLQALPAATAILDATGLVVAANSRWTLADSPLHGAAPGACYLTALRAGTAAGPLADAAARGVAAVLAGDAAEFDLDHPASAASGWFTMRVRPLDTGGAVVTHTDVTAGRRRDEHLAFALLHDELTGLPNRTLYMDRLRQALARSARRLTSVAVMLLDLDDFKLVNDSLGHRTGDVVLMEVAHRLSSALRPGDTVARLGGDEFAILCEEIVDEDQALDLAERLAGVVEEPLHLGTRRVAVTGSVGIALSAGLIDVEALVRDADSAMYRAKEKGRGRCQLFDEQLRQRALRRLELEQDLRHALEHDEFVVAYQPVVELATGVATHVEALVRWVHPQRGLISPAEFIPIAEETGQIVAVGRWVLAEACRQGAAWLRELDTPVTIAVNLSPRQLADPRLVTTVQRTLCDTGLPAAMLCLELTESAIMQDVAGAVETLGRLRRLGVRLSVDDFGTGYSSLAYLRRFPIDQLKIDRSFVAALGHADDVALVQAVVDLARTLRMNVVAEGVERPDQAEVLRELRCDRAQGYLFARPMAAADVTPLLGVPLGDRA